MGGGSTPPERGEKPGFLDRGSWLGDTIAWYKWQVFAPAVESWETDGLNSAKAYRSAVHHAPTTDSPAGTLRYGAKYEQFWMHGNLWYYSWAICTKWRGSHDLTCQKARFYAEKFLFPSQLEDLDAGWERGWLDPTMAETGIYGHYTYSERSSFTRQRRAREARIEQRRAQLEEEGVENAADVQAALNVDALAEITQKDQKLLRENLRLASLATANAQVAASTSAKDSLADKYLAAAKHYDAQRKAAFMGLRDATGSTEAAQQLAVFPAPSQKVYEDDRQLKSFFRQQVKKTQLGQRLKNFSSAVQLEIAALQARVKGDKQALEQINREINTSKVVNAWKNYSHLLSRPPRLLDLATKSESHHHLQSRLAHEAFHRTRQAVKNSEQLAAFEKLKAKWERIVSAPSFYFDENQVLKATGVSAFNAFKNNHSLGFEKLLNTAVITNWKRFYGDSYPLSSAAGAKDLANPTKLYDFQKRFNGLYNWLRRNSERFLYHGMTQEQWLPTREINYENPGQFEIQSSFGTRLWPEAKYGSGRPWLFDFEQQSEKPRSKMESFYSWQTAAQ